MTRLKADLLLLLTAALWGAAFVAQKTSMDGLGPFSFIWLRFLLSFIVVLPFFWREQMANALPDRKTILMMIPVCFAFAGGVVMQQIGIKGTSVTNAGFITGLYVILTPVLTFVLFKKIPTIAVLPACLLSIAGLWFLNGGSFSALNRGDFYVLLCAIFFAGHVALTAWFLERIPRPMLLVTAQYMACVIVGGLIASNTEIITIEEIKNNWMAIAYAGIISGGIAYTLQAVAQQYTPPSDAAIIMSAESLFAALTGILLLKEEVTIDKVLGCAFIFMAILCVEAGGLIIKKRRVTGAVENPL